MILRKRSLLNLAAGLADHSVPNRMVSYFRAASLKILGFSLSSARTVAIGTPQMHDRRKIRPGPR